MVTWLGTPLRVSNSEIQTLKDCPRRWYLTYYRELGIRRSEDKPVGARQLGTRIHIALCAMYEDKRNPIDVIDEVYKDDEAFYNNPDDIVELRKEQDLAHAMLEGYVDWVASEAADEGIELVAAETVIEVPSAVEGVILRGKLDQRVVRKVDGARLFLDHKTVASLTEPMRMLPLDEQMKFYHLLERLDGLHKGVSEDSQWRTDGGLYNMLRKVKRTATAKPPFYGRAEVHHNEQVLRNMWTRVHRVIEHLVEVRQALDAGADHQYITPPRPSRDCTWKCDFFAVCPMMDDGSNVEGLLEEYYTHVDPHERYNAEDNGREVTA